MTQTTDYRTELACALNGYRALIVPDLHNNDSQHWQSIWQTSLPRASRILMHDWHCADWVKWRNSIIASLISIDEPVVLIAEGFGALAAASVAAEYPGKVIALFLVDPADPDQFDVRKKIPKQALPVPSKIVIRNSAAEDDAKAALLAALWGANFSHTVASEAAPDKSAAHYWPLGVHALNGLMAKTQSKVEAINQARTKKILAYLRAMKKTQPVDRLHFHYS